MSRPQVLRPLASSASRLLREQIGLSKAPVLKPPTLRPITKPSVCWSCSFTLQHQSRLYSSSPSPPNNSKTPSSASKTPEPSKAAENHVSSTSAASQSGTERVASSALDSEPDLPSAQNSRRSQLNVKLSNFMDRAQASVFVASQRLNDLTGYSGIETLKSQIAALEASLNEAQQQLHNARTEYKSTVASRSATQREVNTLLARQKSWSPADFERFTDLYRNDYELEAKVTEAAKTLEEAEREAEKLNNALNTGILARYHEEQIWSDKIRRMSTWGTWGLMGVNILLFFLFQFGSEPWRRKRLVKGFEEKVKEALEQERQRDANLVPASSTAIPTVSGEGQVETVANVATAEHETGQEADAAQEAGSQEPLALGGRPTSGQQNLLDPLYWQDAAKDLISERVVRLRMWDVTLVALEGAAAGAALAGTIVFIICRGR